MKFGLQQNVKLTQQLLMTPQLQQAIKLLQLSKIELEQFVQVQISENPALEEIDTTLTSDTNKNDEKISSGDSLSDLGFKRDDYLNYSSQASGRGNIGDREHPNYENYTSYSISLSEHLLSQLGLLKLTKAEQNIAVLIVGNLSEQGFLDQPLEELVIKEDIDYQVAQKVLQVIQALDPVGIGAQNIQESLLIQLQHKNLQDGLIENIIKFSFDSLLRRNYHKIAKELNVNMGKVRKSLAVLTELNFAPGCEFTKNNNSYIVPDVYVYKENNEWTISLNDDGAPCIQVNSYYKEMYKSMHSGADKEYLLEKIRDARWLLKSLEQRKKTIFLVTKVILEKQKSFFNKGITELKPLVLRDVAEQLNMHESTISRVTSNKYIHTPMGTYELKFFFNSSLSKKDGETLASESVRALIKDIISTENPEKPYSDQKITHLLNKRGVDIARRTVTKYREKLGFLSSSQRKKF